MPEEVKLEFATAVDPQGPEVDQSKLPQVPSVLFGGVSNPFAQIQNTNQPVNIQPQSSVIAPAINELMVQQGGEAIQGMNQAQQSYTSPLTVQDINPNYYPEYATGGYEALGEDPQIAALNNQILAAQGATSPGALAPTTYVPGLGQPINVGTYSGSVIGSNPIFAATDQYVPMGIADARERALQDAAINAAKLEGDKAAAEMKLNAFEIPKAPQLDNKNYQRAFNREFNEFNNKTIAEAKRLYGKDWARALKDSNTEIGRDYQQKLAQYQYIAERGNQFTNKVATLQKAIDDGTMHTSPYVKKLMKDSDNAMGDFGSGDPVDLYKLEGQLNAVLGVDNFLKKYDIVSPEMRAIKQNMAGTSSRTEYDILMSRYRASASESAERLVRQAYSPGGQYEGEEDLMPPEALYDAIMGRLGDIDKTEFKTASTPQRGKQAYEDDREAIIGVDEYGNYTIPGNTEKEYRTGMTISDAEGIEGGIKPGDKVKLSELKTVRTRPDGSIIRDGEGNPIYENKAVWSVKRKETVEYTDGGDLKTKDVEKDYVVTADSDGESRVWLKKDHNTQYKAQQDLSDEAGVKTKTGVEEKDYEDPNRGNRNTRGFLKTTKADAEKEGLTKEEEDFFK